MTNLLIASNVGLWIVVSFLVLTILALTRQIGLLHRRLLPMGARTTTEGPPIGARAPEFDVLDLSGRQFTLAGRARMTLIAFVAPDCSVCAQLLPGLKALRQAERRHLDVVVFSLTSDETKNREYIAAHKIGDIPFAASGDVVDAYNVRVPPYAVLVGADGIVKAKGMVNHFEHLESLLTAARVGHPTFESYIADARLAQSKEDDQRPLAGPKQAAHA